MKKQYNQMLGKFNGLTDLEGNFLSRLLPDEKNAMGRLFADARNALKTIAHLLTTDVACAMCPSENSGPKKSALIGVLENGRKMELLLRLKPVCLGNHIWPVKSTGKIPLLTVRLPGVVKHKWTLEKGFRFCVVVQFFPIMTFCKR